MVDHNLLIQKSIWSDQIMKMFLVMSEKAIKASNLNIDYKDCAKISQSKHSFLKIICELKDTHFKESMGFQFLLGS